MNLKRKQLVGMGIVVAVVGMAAMLFGARLLAARLAGHRIPSAQATLHDWERSVMVEILQLAIMISAGLLLLAMLQPFLAIQEGVAIVALMMAAIIVVLWRGARRLASTGRNPSRCLCVRIRPCVCDASENPRTSIIRRGFAASSDFTRPSGPQHAYAYAEW